MRKETSETITVDSQFELTWRNSESASEKTCIPPKAKKCKVKILEVNVDRIHPRNQYRCTIHEKLTGKKVAELKHRFPEKSSQIGYADVIYWFGLLLAFEKASREPNTKVRSSNRNATEWVETGRVNIDRTENWRIEFPPALLDEIHRLESILKSNRHLAQHLEHYRDRTLSLTW